MDGRKIVSTDKAAKFKCTSFKCVCECAYEVKGHEKVELI